MNSWHNQLLKKYPHYHQWHQHPHHPFWHWVVFSFFTALTFIYLFTNILDYRNQEINQIGLEIPQAQAAGTTYYVSTSGNDANSGTAAAPFRTIQKCVNAVIAGDTCLVKAGTYYELVNVSKSGTASARIAIKGERGPNGEYLAVIDGGIIQLTGWVQAPEIGAGVWKRQSPSWTGPQTGLQIYPSSLTANGKSIWKINESNSNDQSISGDGATVNQILSRAAAADCATTVGPRVQCWDGIEALFAIKPNGNIYVRFRNGDDPNTKTIRVAPGSYYNRMNAPEFAPIFIRNQSYITVSDLELRGAEMGAVISGQAHNNIIENSIVKGTDVNVLVYQTAADPSNGPQNAVIRNNKIFDTALGYDTYPPIIQSNASYARAVAAHQYHINKYIVGTSDELSFGVKNYFGSGTQILNNEIYHKSVAIWGYNSMTLANNSIHNANGGTCLYFDGWQLVPGTVISVFDNLIYECGVPPLRSNDLGRPESANLSLYFYRNKIYVPTETFDGSVYHSFTGGHPETGLDSKAKIFIYHNTSIGGGRLYAIHNPMDEGLPNVLFVNNLVQVTQSTQNIVQNLAGWYPKASFCNNAGKLGGWDYNWHFGSMPTCAWVGTHNVNSSSKIISDTSLPADWSLPSGATARAAGVDISKSFTIGGKIYAALPGFSPGYFSGTAPDIGAVQSGTTSSSTPTPTPTPIPTPTPSPSDTTPPIISNVSAQITGQTTVTISWNAGEPATGQVEYGLTTSYGLNSILESSFNYSSHSQNLSGLTPGTLYHFRVKSKDAAGNLAISNDFTFTTLGSSPTPILSSCDLNQDTKTDILDFQLLANVILGLSPNTGGYDINKDGQTNILDTQVLANVVLLKNSCP